MSNEQIVLASIGPVQGFIASARRCQDLWFGSWLLSELSRVVARTMEEEAELVFPGNLHDKASVANKVLAVTRGSDGASLAKRAGQTMQAHLEAIASYHFDRYERRLGARAGRFHREVAETHVRELIEYQWVVVPIREDYGRARSEAERLLAMRKATRNWPQVEVDHRSAGVPKSSIDGSRESVLDEWVYDHVPPEKRRSLFFVKKSERLSGTDLLKRLGLELELDREDERTADAGEWRGRLPKVFHSTSHVASLPLLTRIERRGEVARTALGTYLQALDDLGLDRKRFVVRAGGERSKATVRAPYGSANERELEVERVFHSFEENGLAKGYDGVLLFDSRLEDAFEEAPTEKVEDISEAVRRAKGALRSFLRNGLGYGGDATPYAYYVMLLADGDRMGAAIDALGSQADAQEQHAALSRRLDEFARSARGLIEEHGGSAIYTGGDDVLALLPLHTALECAEALRASFEEAVGQRVGGGHAPTLSVGLAIVHHLEPMRQARALAKEAEQAAKRHRNSLAIAAKMRSGGTRIVRGSWSEPKNLAERIRLWAELLSSGEVPHALGFELEQAVRPFEVGSEKDQEAFADVIRALTKRVLARRRAQGDTCLDEGIQALVNERVSSVESLASLSAELQIARLFERAWNLAWEVRKGTMEESK